VKKNTSVIIASFIGAIAVLIAALIGLQGKDKEQQANHNTNIGTSTNSPVYQAGRDIVIQQSTKPTQLPSRVPRNIIEKKTKLSVLNKALDSGNIKKVEKPLFDFAGGTDEERSMIANRLVELEVRVATINISKSVRDNSRNVYIQVTYQDNTSFTDSFNTPLDNTANLIISEIDNRRRKQ
jgi:hypothetical protein